MPVIDSQPPPSYALPERPPSLAVDLEEEEVEDTGGPAFGGPNKLERRLTNESLGHPGDVRINVRGAFIVDTEDEAVTPGESFDVEGYQHDPRDIRLPHHQTVVSHVAVDIGGSLAKLVYFSHEAGENGIQQGGRLNFLKFETANFDVCIKFMKRLKTEYLARGNGDGNGRSKTPDLCVMATGGGAYKYYDRIREALGVEVLREDEMACLIIGLDFFISEIPCEIFTYSETNPMEFHGPSTTHAYPYLLVNIGSGVSMIKVSGPREFQRVGGTSLGGGTLWGLLSLLTGARNFEEMLAMAEKGDNTAVDMLVGDIYGTDYGKIGLKSTTIASSFGKVYRVKRQAERDAEDHGGLANSDDSHTPLAEYTSDPLDSAQPSSRPTSSGGQPNATSAPFSQIHFRPEDISRSLLYAISNNIGQIAFLHANRHKCHSIFFGGSFIGGHWQTMATLSYAIKFWSGGEKRAYFLRHEGYLGAVGAFLKRRPQGWGRRGSLDLGTPVRGKDGE